MAVPPRVSLVHPTGNPFARQAALALAEAEVLKNIITCLAHNPDGIAGQLLQLLPSFLAKPLIQELSRRTWTSPPGSALKMHPWRELLRIGLIRSGLSPRLGFKAIGPIDWVYAGLDHQVAKHHLQGLTALYAYEDGAASSFERAKRQGVLCLYDLPILFYRMARTIQQEEAERFPDLASALQAIHEPQWKLHRKEQEIALADHIFVASSITRNSLLAENIAPERISVIPYGAPTDYFAPAPKRSTAFRPLFVGRVGPRKGVHYLLTAWSEMDLPQATLTMIGVNEFPAEWLEGYLAKATTIQHIPTVPHLTLESHYTNASVLVFPSLVEGFGLVLLEAMACGIPVITTPHTAGPDLITNGVEGFIVPIRDVEALKEKLEWCYQHPEALAEMGRAARQKAEQLTWGSYRQRLSHKVQELLGTSCEPQH